MADRVRRDLELLWLLLRRRVTLDEARGLRRLRPGLKEDEV